MIMTLMKFRQTLRTLLRRRVALIITLCVLLGVLVLQTPGFFIASAHAMETGKAAVLVQTRCASQPSVHNCTGQDPVVQGCDRDAQTLAFKEFPGPQGTLRATLERRYSPTCHSEWGRITNDGRQPLEILIGKTMRSTAGGVAFSTMVFVPNLSVAPELRGDVSTNGLSPEQAGSMGQTTFLPALPPVQK